MKRNKQTTLLNSWKRPALINTHHAVEQTPADVIECLDDGTDLMLDDFFEDDVADEVASASQTAANTSLNASLFEDIPGFDMDKGKTYVYPTNYEVRDYQFNIVKKCLFKNTLVSLPTGLGKTFIAAVLMYNYYRWYPDKKVVFLAPTKPLVAQQIEACFGIMGIPQSDTAEMTGSMAPRDRAIVWQSKRVFFLTPQVMQNDLGRGTCPSADVCCVVFDEAHKALGNYAYCQVVKDMVNAKALFRVLALSATPGNDLKAVQQVVSNLLISQIVLRSEESIDIHRYLHKKQVDKIVVPLEGIVLGVKSTLRKIMSTIVNRLSQSNALYTTELDRLGKFQLLQARDQFRSASSVKSGSIEGDFAIGISLFHSYELLLQHGLRSFYQFLNTSLTEGYKSRAKQEVLSNREFKSMMEMLRNRIVESGSPQLNSSMYCPSVSNDTPFFYGHPKLNKLEEVILDHFKSFKSGQTRVMVFSQYRDSVKEIADMLSRHAPMIRVMSFMGHGTTNRASKGQTQREQIEVVEKFREGGYNTLISTCVGEEGLDIGEVDLIVCFDAHKSPVRLVQRMGRTGRKRSGRIVMIMAEGKEEQIYNKSQSTKNSIHKAIQKGSSALQYYLFSPRMVPRHIHPEVEKVFISPGSYIQSKGKKAIKASKPPVQTFRFGPSSKNDPKGVFLTEAELLYWNNHFKIPDNNIEPAVSSCVQHRSLSALKMDDLNGVTCDDTKLSLDRWIHWQTVIFPTKVINHSAKSMKLRNVLEFTDHLQMTPGLGCAYGSEMMAFLDYDDLEDDCHKDECSDVIQSVRGVIKRNKRRMIEELSSEDEDFRTKRSKLNQASPNGSRDIAKVNIDVDRVLPECSGNSALVGVDPAPIGVDSFTPPLSQSIVPTAPSSSKLEWLDNISSNLPSDFSLTQMTSGLQDMKCSKSVSRSSSLADKDSLDFTKDIATSQDGPAESFKGIEDIPSPDFIDLCEEDILNDDIVNDENSPLLEDKQQFVVLESPLDVKHLSKASVRSTKSDMHPKSAMKSPHPIQCIRPTSPGPSHSTPSSRKTVLFQTPDSEETMFRNAKKTRRHLRQPDFLCSQVNTQPCKTNVTRDDNTIGSGEGDDDFYMQPLRKRLLLARDPFDSDSEDNMGEVKGADGFIDEEAELSEGYSSPDEPLDQTDHEYDYDDSFINDNSVLTQHVPAGQSGNSRNVPADKMDVYLRSLRTPDKLFASKKSSSGNKFRLVLSQRYELLNKYMKKAKLKASPSAYRHKSKRHVSVESEESEAEEVMKVTDDPEFNDSQDTRTECVADDYDYDDENSTDSNEIVEPVEKIKRRNMRKFFESDESLVLNLSTENSSFSKYDTNTAKINTTLPIEISSSSSDEMSCHVIPPPLDCDRIAIRVTELLSQNMIVSPSLVIESLNEDYSSKNDSPLSSESVFLSMAHSLDSCSVDDIHNTSMDLCTDISEFEIGSDVELFSDNDIVIDDQDCKPQSLVPDYDTRQNTVHHQHKDTSVSIPIAIVSAFNPAEHNVADRNNSKTCDRPLSEENSMIVLMDSKEQICSQVVSCLRHKEHISVEVCSMGQNGGYAISNRAVLETTSQSDLSTVSLGNKLISRLQYLQELYDKVFLVIEAEENQGKCKLGKVSRKSSHDLYTSLLAKVSAKTSVTILYTNSKESTATIIAGLVKAEYNKGFGIYTPLALIRSSTNTNELKLLLKAPGMTFITALNLIAFFPDLSSIVSCRSPNEMQQGNLKYLSKSKADAFLNFFQKHFNHYLAC